MVERKPQSRYISGMNDIHQTQKKAADRVPYEGNKASDMTAQTFHTVSVFLSELEAMTDRMRVVCAKMDKSNIRDLPEAVKDAKRKRGVSDLRSFIDGIEDAVTHEIRYNVEQVAGPKDSVSDVSD